MKEWEKAWVAAMIDSRAHIVRKVNKQRAAGSEQIVLQLETRHSEIAQRLSAMTGTSPEELAHKMPGPELMRRSCIEHCPDAHVHVDTLAMMPKITKWTVTGASAAVVLWNVREYMATTREPWEWAMTQVFSQLKLSGPGSGAIRAAVQRLYLLGWDIPPVLQPMLPRELEAR